MPNRTVDYGLPVILLVLSFIEVFAKNKPQTVLTRQLLRGYEPLPPPDGPTNVSLGIYVNYFYGVSEQTMDYMLSFYIREEWYDKRFLFDPLKHSNITVLRLDDSELKKIWIPDVFFRNEKGASFHQVTQPNRLLYINSDSRMWYVSKISATFSCPMQLQKYPMDKQECPIIFESFGYKTDTVIFKWLPAPLDVDFDKTGKDLPEMIVENFKTKDCSSEEGFPCLELRFIMKRPLGYFMIQFFVPSILLVSLSWVSFWISIDAVVARVAIGLLAVLNLVTQSTGSRNQLPKVSYVKAIDVWMTACLFFAFASLIEFAVVNVWSRMDAREKRAKEGGGGGGGGAAEIGAVTAGGSSTTPTKKKEEEDIPMQQMQLDVPGRNRGRGRRVRRLSNLSNLGSLVQQQFSVHQHRAKALDRLSRKVFPGSFILFNVIFWMVYML